MYQLLHTFINIYYHQIFLILDILIGISAISLKANVGEHFFGC